MPRTVEMLCLANSYRDQGRCIAGLSLPELQWVRPVTSAGSLDAVACEHFLPLDVIRVQLARPVPEPAQPENWLLASTSITRVRRATPVEAFRWIAAALTRGPTIFGDRLSATPAAALRARPPDSSLVVLEPESISWHHEHWGASHKSRAKFKLAGTAYDLSVTDPRWREAMIGLPLNEPADRSFGGAVRTQDRLALTVSLAADPFNGSHYKLVAAVLVLHDMRIAGAAEAALGPGRMSLWRAVEEVWPRSVPSPSAPARVSASLPGIRQGSQVTLRIDGVQSEYAIDKTVPGIPLLSSASPVGRAILGHRAGEEVVVSAPRGQVDVVIVAVRQ